MENKLLNFSYELYIPSQNEYVLNYQDKYFKIETLLYKILLLGQTSKNINELHTNLNAPDISMDDLNTVINKKIIPVFEQKKEEKPEEQQSNYWLKFELLNSDWTTKISKPFATIYGRLFYLVFGILLAANIGGIYQLHVFSKGISLIEVKYMPIYYIGLLMIIFLHEIGHAAASIKSGIFPRGIGLGFYTIMPVMYTDLTDTWRVGKKEKIKINLGGLYIQMILNSGLFFLAHFTGSDSFAHVVAYNLMFTNTVIMLLNLIPFLKFDGYWILSDLLSIPDLMERSNKTVKGIFVKADPFAEKKKEEFNFKKLFIITYSILRAVYIIMMVVGIFGFIFLSLSKTIKFIMNIPYMELSGATAMDGLSRLVSIVIIYLFTKNYRKSFVKYFKKK